MTPKFIQRYTETRCNRTLYQRLESKAEIIIVIPAYKEPLEQLRKTVESILSNDVTFHVAVFILINYKENDSPVIKTEARLLYENLINELTPSKANITIKISIEELHGKKSGVGLARKLLMDAAFLCYQDQKKNGIIVNLDADTIVADNYLYSIKEYFDQNEDIEAASISFQHQNLNPQPKEVSSAIVNYELHLRYFINMQRWVGLPYAYQTVGSAMAVRSDAYAKEGGMNVRQAGEDFYFLQKYANNWSLGEINSTTVYPSSRSSDRVPFGTGKAVADYTASGLNYLVSYNPESFKILKYWLEQIEPHLYRVDSGSFPDPNDPVLNGFLSSYDYQKAMVSIVKNSTSGSSRVKKFYNWFDAFKLFKYLHYARHNGRKDLPISECLEMFFELNDTLKPPAPLTAISKNDINMDYLVPSLELLQSYDVKINYNHQWRAALISRLSNT